MFKYVFSHTFFVKTSRLSVTLLISIAGIFAVGSSPSYAASQSPGAAAIQAVGPSALDATSQSSGVSPQGIPPMTWQCFNIAQSVQVTGTNTWAVHGTVTYFCNPQITGGGLTITNTLNCPVTGVGSRTTSSYQDFGQGPFSQNQTWSYVQNYIGHCEQCTDNVPTLFPFFTVDVRTTAKSTEVNGDGAAGSSGNGHIGLTNSPAYAIPCEPSSSI